MYCKQCGKQMDNNAIYCSQCGAKNVFEPIAQEQQTNCKSEQPATRNDDDTNKKDSSGCGFFITFIIIALVAIAITSVVVMGNGISEGTSLKDSINQVTSRDATNRDITIDDELDIGSMSLNIIILPNSNIDNLEITIKYLDKNQNVLRTDVKQIGSVKAGVQVKKYISLTEFSFNEILKISYYEIGVTGGTISYFQN